MTCSLKIKIILALLLAFVSFQPIRAAEKSGGSKGGVKIDAALGSVSASLTNPDDSIAYYNGISLRGDLAIPLIERNFIQSHLSFLGRYLDLSNTASNAAQRELGNHIGPGVGISLSFGHLFFSTQIYQMRARHIWVGAANNYIEFDYTSQSQIMGISWNPKSQTAISLSYEITQAKVSKDQTGLTRDLPYSDSVLWLHLRYSTGTSLWKLVQGLFK